MDLSIWYVATIFVVCEIVLGTLLAIGLVVLGVRFMNMGRDMKDKAKKDSELMMAITKDKVNRVIVQSPEELETWLCRIFSVILEVTVATYITDKDPNAVDILYGRASVEMTNYLGPETIEAINYFYGDGYLTRWMELKYRMIENQGVLNRLISKNGYARDVVKVIDTNEKIGGA